MSASAEWETTDLYLAGFLIASVHQLLALKRVTATRVAFLFPRTAEALSLEWLGGQCSVNARLYADIVRQLKARLASMARGEARTEARAEAMPEVLPRRGGSGT